MVRVTGSYPGASCRCGVYGGDDDDDGGDAWCCDGGVSA